MQNRTEQDVVICSVPFSAMALIALCGQDPPIHTTIKSKFESVNKYCYINSSIMKPKLLKRHMEECTVQCMKGMVGIK